MITIIIISLCAFGAIALTSVIIFRMTQLSSESKLINKRLEFWISGKTAAQKYLDSGFENERRGKEDNFAKRVLAPLGEQVGNWMADKVPYTKQSALRKLLIKAGYRDKKALHLFYAVKIIFACVFGFGILFVIPLIGKEIPGGMFSPFIGAYFGFMFPNIFVNKKAAGRQLNIARVVPDALDLLVICSEAGMGIDQSLLRVASNLGLRGKDLTEEIILTNREINLGQERSLSWLNLGERTDTEELKNLSRVITQAEKVGSSISGVLRNQADFLRVKRRQRAEELAAKMSVKMMIPMALFIFPCVMAVALGPPFLKIIGSFKGM